MMRQTLASAEGERKRFRAEFVRVGKKSGFNGYSQDTILLRNIIDAATGQVVTDHVWFTYSKSFEQALMKEGDTIEFDARVRVYKKGYVNKKYNIDRQRSDFRLSHPTRIKVIH